MRKKNLLEMNNSYVRSFVIIDEQLQSGLLPQSVSLELLEDRQPSSEHRGRYNLPSTNEEVAILMQGKSCRCLRENGTAAAKLSAD